jgi:hypothetical protein
MTIVYWIHELFNVYLFITTSIICNTTANYSKSSKKYNFTQLFDSVRFGQYFKHKNGLMIDVRVEY